MTENTEVKHNEAQSLDGTVSIKTFVTGPIKNNVYLIYKDSVGIVVDASGAFPVISSFCAKNGIKVEAVLITHNHFDHVADVDRWRAMGAKVYMSIADIDMPRGTKNVDKSVKDGEELDIKGIKVKVIATPGHSKGGVCYLVGNHLFSGDTLFCDSYGRTDLHGGDFNVLKKSICEKLFALPPETEVYPGHEHHTSIGKERTRNPILVDTE